MLGYAKINVNKKNPSCTSTRLQACAGLTRMPLNFNLKQISFKTLDSFFLSSLKKIKFTNFKFEKKVNSP